MNEKTIDLLERILLTNGLISKIHFKKPLPALQKLNAEIEQHIRELKNIPSDLSDWSETSAPSETSDLSDQSESDALKAEVEELRYIVEQFSTWTAEGGCVKSNFPDFPCWWERNRVELELDDYCDDDDEREHKCWVEYYRWKYRQKLNGTGTNVLTKESEVKR